MSMWISHLMNQEEFSGVAEVAAGDYSLKKDIVVYSEKSVIKDDLFKVKV